MLNKNQSEWIVVKKTGSVIKWLHFKYLEYKGQNSGIKIDLADYLISCTNYFDIFLWVLIIFIMIQCKLDNLITFYPL